MMAVPERQLLIPMDDITGVIDIQCHRLRFNRIAGAVNADHRGHHAHQFAGRRGILPPAHGRLADQPGASTRQLAKRQTEAGIIAQRVEVVGVLVAAADRKDTRSQDVGYRVDHPRRIARVGNARGKLFAKTHAALGLGQQ